MRYGDTGQSGSDSEFLARLKELGAFKAERLGGEPSDNELARRAGTSRTTVGDWLRGRRFPQEESKLGALVRAIAGTAATKKVAAPDADLLDPGWWHEAHRKEAERRAGKSSETARRVRAERTLAPGRSLSEETAPFDLEVHRPVAPDAVTSRDLPLLPPYVRRPLDEELARVTRAATEGHSDIAVLVGDSSTGKTRACWETLQIIRDTSIPSAPWRLWHPLAPSRSGAVLKNLPNVAPHTVIWLNEAQLYLGVHDGEEVAAALRELLKNGKSDPVLVLATLWTDHWSTLTTRPGYSAPDPHAQARELLTDHYIHVPSRFTEPQLNDLAKAEDPRLLLAASHASDGEVIQYLASAPELLSCYVNAPSAPKALIDAAMDARRLGVADLIPRSFLEAAVPGYLTDREWNSLEDGWLPKALTYTGQPCKGALGPLVFIRQRPDRSSASHGETYRLADYLNQHSRHTHRTRIPPLDFWTACETLTDRIELRDLGNAAEARGILRNAARLHKRAAALGDAKAAARLVRRLHQLDPETASAAWQLLDDLAADEIDAVTELVGALAVAGAAERTTALLESAMTNAALDDPGDLALLLSAAQRAHPDESAGECAAPLIARDPAAHVPADNLLSVAKLAEQLRLGRAPEQATSLMSRAAAEASLDEVEGVRRAIEVMLRLGATEPLATLLARDPAAHVPLNDLLDLANLLASLSKAGAEEQIGAAAARISAVPVAPDNLDTLQTLVGELWESGSKEPAIALARRAATCAGPNDPKASVLVSRMLETVEAEEFIPALLDQCPVEYANLTEPAAVFALLDALQEAYAEIDVLLERDPAASVICDDPEGLANLLNILMKLDPEQLEHDPLDQVATLCARDLGALVLDTPASVAFLLEAMWKAGAAEQAGALARRAAEGCGNLATGVKSLLYALRHVGAEAEAATLINRLPGEECFERFLVDGDNKVVYRFGREPDGTPAHPWGWEDLDLSGCTRSPLRGPRNVIVADTVLGAVGGDDLGGSASLGVGRSAWTA